MNNGINFDEIARIICTLNNTATAIFMLTPELEIMYINNASAILLRQYAEEFSSVNSIFDPDHVVGLYLDSIGIIPDDKLECLKDPKNLPFAKFIDVGKEKFHITINPLYTEDGKFMGSAGDWWWATEYLNGQEDRQKVTDINTIIDVIDNITFQSDILFMNAVQWGQLVPESMDRPLVSLPRRCVFFLKVPEVR